MIKEIKTLEEFKDIRSEWDQLYTVNSDNTPFQSWEWQYSWCKYIGSYNNLLILMVYDESSELCGIAPLCIRNKYKALRFKNINFIGEKRADYLDFLFVPGREDVFFNRLFEYLVENKNHWNLLRFVSMPKSSKSFDFIYSSISNRFKYFMVENNQICVSIQLVHDWDDFISRLGSRTRKDVKYDRRYIEKRFKVDFKIYSDPENMEEAFDQLTEVYRKRWRKEKGITKFDNSGTYNFEKSVCISISQHGYYRIFVLYINDKPVSALSGFIRNKIFFGDVFAHDPQYWKYSVGNVLLGYCIEYCIQNKLNELDLSRGNEQYKYKWKGIEKRNLHINIYRSRKALVYSQIIDTLYEMAVYNKVINYLYHFLSRIFNKVLLVIKMK